MAVSIGNIEARVNEIEPADIVMVVDDVMLQAPALRIAQRGSKTPVEYGDDFARLMTEIPTHNGPEDRIVNHFSNARAARRLPNTPNRHQPAVGGLSLHHVRIGEGRPMRVVYGMQRLR